MATLKSVVLAAGRGINKKGEADQAIKITI